MACKRQDCFKIPRDIFHVILSVGNKNCLVGDWTNIIYREFNALVPTCPLQFFYNHCRTEGSRKRKCSFWIGKAKCKIGNSKVMFYIKELPENDCEPVSVTFEISCPCVHRFGDAIASQRQNGGVHRCFRDESAIQGKSSLKGEERTKFVKELIKKKITSNSLHVEKMANVNMEEPLSGNMTNLDGESRHSQEDVVVSPSEEIMFYTLSEELTSDEVDDFMVKCHHMLTDGISGLQLSGLGFFCWGLSHPRFVAERKKFVQIINVGDHWTFCTNLFSDTNNHVYVYDSMCERINEISRVMISSLLRMGENRLNVGIKAFARQAAGTRLCGYYACAALFLALGGVDPSYLINDINKIKKLYYDVINNQIIDTAELLDYTLDTSIVYSESFEKLICLCQRKITNDTIQCSKCQTFYHLECIDVKNLLNEWVGPCCLRFSEYIEI